MFHKTIRSTVALVAFGFSLSAATAQMVYNRGNAGDPETLDPQKTSTVVESDILLDLYEGLVTYDAKAQIVPGVAESWSANDDGTVYTFKLRSNAKWSNGDPVKAQRFRLLVPPAMNPETGREIREHPLHAQERREGQQGPGQGRGTRRQGHRRPHAGDHARDSRPRISSRSSRTRRACPCIPASVEKFGKDFVKPENMVSNGAFMLKSFTPNDKIVMVKNPNYRDAASVKIDQVNFFSDRGPLRRRCAASRRANSTPTTTCRPTRSSSSARP